MTAYKVIVAERKDLVAVTVVCPNPKCGAHTSFDIDVEHPPGTSNAGRIPQYCASCEVRFEDPLHKALAGLAMFHHAAREAEQKTGKTIFLFEIRQPEA